MDYSIPVWRERVSLFVIGILLLYAPAKYRISSDGVLRTSEMRHWSGPCVSVCAALEDCSSVHIFVFLHLMHILLADTGLSTVCVNVLNDYE